MTVTNIVGDKLLLNNIFFFSAANFSALIYNFCEITKLPWQHSGCLSSKMVSRF